MADKIWIHDRVKSLISLNFPSIFLFLFSFLRLFIYRDDRPCYERSNTAWESVHYLSCSGWSGGVGGSRTKFSYITENPPRQTKVSLGPPWKKILSLNMQSVLGGQSNWSLTLTLIKKRMVRLVWIHRYACSKTHISNYIYCHQVNSNFTTC